MSRLRLKIYGTVALALVFALLLVMFDRFTRYHFENTSEFQSLLLEIESAETGIDKELFESSFSLYRNYDRLEAGMNEVQNHLTRLKSPDLLQGFAFSKTRKALTGYENYFKEKSEKIQRFKTLNSPMKNSSMYLSRILLDIQRENLTIRQPEYFALLMNIQSSVSLYRSSFDPDFVKDLGSNIEKLGRYQIASAGLRTHHELYLAHAKVFLQYYPDYQRIIADLREDRGSKILEELRNEFQRENQTYRQVITILNVAIGVGLTAAFALIIYFLIKGEKENRKLNALTEELERSIQMDRLTGLFSRYSFERDQGTFQEPICILANIDGFKHINDFYGTSAGDLILNQVGAVIKEQTEKIPCRAIAYRPGADDFLILYEASASGCRDQELLIASDLITALDHKKYVYEGFEVFIRISLGISRGDRLFEKADMVLKYVKRETRLRFLEYEEALGLYEKISSNIELLHFLKKSLQESRIHPYFQPIVSNETGSIVKYECLARFRENDESYILPSDIFRIAAEARLSSQVAGKLLKQALELFERRSDLFSFNLSYEDIMDHSLREMIFESLDRYPDVAKRLTFEFLESEKVNDYEFLRKFIQEVKKRGCSIAIDDFGSGYSNFNLLLRLNVDYVKIDGALIRNVHRDQSAKHLVQTVVDFCKKTGLKTVAEYVHSEEVFKEVKKMGVDYSQGYYFGKPIDLSRADREP